MGRPHVDYLGVLSSGQSEEINRLSYYYPERAVTTGSYPVIYAVGGGSTSPEHI